MVLLARTVRPRFHHKSRQTLTRCPKTKDTHNLLRSFSYLQSELERCSPVLRIWNALGSGKIALGPLLWLLLGRVELRALPHPSLEKLPRPKRSPGNRQRAGVRKASSQDDSVDSLPTGPSEHTAVTWASDFPTVVEGTNCAGFAPEYSMKSPRQLTRTERAMKWKAPVEWEELTAIRYPLRPVSPLAVSSTSRG